MQKAVKTRFILVLTLVFLLIPFLVFTGLSFCSFPSSDDFIMAQDLKKGFFWAIQYWLGFWLSSWTTAATELSIPLAFGHYDYGIFFFLFLSSCLYGSLFFCAEIFLRSRSLSVALSTFLFAMYLIFVPLPSETLFWNIGALAYTLPISALFSVIAVHFRNLQNLRKVSARKSEGFIMAGLLILSSLIVVWIWKVLKIPRFIQIMDSWFPPDHLYAYWVSGIAMLIFLFFLADKFQYVNYLLLGILVFLVVGTGPQIAMFLLAYAGAFTVFELSHVRKISRFNWFFLCATGAFVVLLLKMPGSGGRMSLTNPNLVKDIHFYLKGNFHLLTTHYWTNNVLFGYLLSFCIGLLFKRVFAPKLSLPNALPLWLVLMAAGLHFLALVILHFSNGHFPLRLSTNFIFLNLVLSTGLGLASGLPQWIEINFPRIHVPAALLVFFLLMMISPNFLTAAEEFFSGRALQYRSYKLEQYNLIKTCPGDTCGVPYRAFDLKILPQQHFILPGDKGFPLSHKLFVSRCLDKEFIYYIPETLPAEMR